MAQASDYELDLEELMFSCSDEDEEPKIKDSEEMCLEPTDNAECLLVSCISTEQQQQLQQQQQNQHCMDVPIAVSPYQEDYFPVHGIPQYEVEVSTSSFDDAVSLPFYSRTIQHGCGDDTCSAEGVHNVQNLTSSQATATSRNFTCHTCGFHSSTRSALMVHIRKKHSNSWQRSMSSRKGTSTGTFSCHKCEYQSSARSGLTEHIHREHNTSGNKQGTWASFTCHTCGHQAPSRSELMVHIRRDHSTPWEPPTYQWGDGDQPPWVNADGTSDDKLKDIYTRFGIREIEKPHTIGDISSRYNFHLPLGVVTPADINIQLEHIYGKQEHSFKVNLSLGIVLRNQTSGDYRYWWAHYNDPVLSSPELVSNRENLETLKAKLKLIDFQTQAWHQRPSTNFRLVRVTNIRWYITNMSFVLGNPQNLPEFIVRSKCMLSFNTRTDNLCAFRCLAYHNLKKKRGLETLTQQYFSDWKIFKKLKNSAETYKGIDINDLPSFESFFKISVNVFSLKDSGTVQVVYKSTSFFPTNMDLNLHENHLSYITRFSSYAHKFQCRNCGYMATRIDVLRKHEISCDTVTKLTYPGGFYGYQHSFFDDLNGLQCNVPKEEQFFPYFAVYDFEAYLEPQEQTNSMKTQWVAEHNPISVGVSSNVPGFEESKCFIDEDAFQLVESMLLYLQCIKDKSTAIMKERFCKHITFLTEQMVELADILEASMAMGTTANNTRSVEIVDNEDSLMCTDDDDNTMDMYSHEAKETNECEPPSAEFIKALQTENTFHQYLREICEDKDNTKTISDFQQNTMNGSFSSESSMDITDNDAHNTDNPMQQSVNTKQMLYTPEDIEAKKVQLKMYRRILKDLNKFCCEFPVLGFNSAKYDINLVKANFIKGLKKGKEGDKESFVVKRNNAYVCISLNSFRFLDVTQYLAPGTNYANFLKAYECTQNKGFFPYEWFDSPGKLNCTSLPSHKEFFSSFKNYNISDEEYSLCQTVWKDKNMTTFKDFLEWYNILDVEPFVQAVDKMRKFYQTYGVDLFKETLSVPGVARKLIFKSIENKAFFALPTKQFADIHNCFKENIVGGPSIVFHRYHEAGETYIRNGDLKCMSILGLDFNSLYLFSFSLPAPSGPMTVRRHENNFKPEKSEKFMTAFKWLEWEAAQNNCFIQHKLNGGEKQIGPYRADGFNIETNMIFSFHGCYHHCHGIGADCYLTNHTKGTFWTDKGPGVYERTLLRKQFFISQGYRVKEIWECEFNVMVKNNIQMKSFINNNFTRKTDSIGKMTFDQILKFIRNETIFGAAEVDIEVPPDLHEKFSELSPIFCNTTVEYENFGEHMQEYLAFTDGNRKGRRVLVGVMKAKKILIATPLLKWYLEHGLKVTHIYKVIEYTPSVCFSKFVNMVIEGRRKGDKDPKYELIGQTLKLIGNSAYGSMLMDATKHTNIVYTTEPNKAKSLVNDKRFRKLVEIDSDLFEVELAKKNIKLNLPIQIGFFILQYAKLRMLEFYYDFLDIYIDRSKFQLVCMDTDSFYIALAEEEFEACVRAELRTSYLAVQNKWFPRSTSPEEYKFDQRTPGLLKTEFKGDVIVALCSKTYCVENKVATNPKEKTKYSCKGLMKTAGENPLIKYFEVLRTGEKSGSLNKGFRVHDGKMFTYTQYRDGLSYFYCKRKVHSDGVTTSPLDIVGSAG